MTNNEKEQLTGILDRLQIKSLFYTEKCTKGGIYHILRWDDKENEWVEDDILGERENEHIK